LPAAAVAFWSNFFKEGEHNRLSAVSRKRSSIQNPLGLTETFNGIQEPETRNLKPETPCFSLPAFRFRRPLDLPPAAAVLEPMNPVIPRREIIGEMAQAGIGHDHDARHTIESFACRAIVADCRDGAPVTRALDHLDRPARETAERVAQPANLTRPVSCSINRFDSTISRSACFGSSWANRTCVSVCDPNPIPLSVISAISAALR